METENIENSLKSLFDGILASSNKNAVELADTVFPDGTKLPFEKLDDARWVIIRPATKLLKGVFLRKYPNLSYEAQFLIEHTDYVENHFRSFIQKVEGGACCVDKTWQIINGLLAFFLEKISEIEIGWRETIFTTHNECITFFEAIKSMYFGNYEKYLVWLKAFHENGYMPIAAIKDKHRLVLAIDNNTVAYVPEGTDLEALKAEKIAEIKSLIAQDTTGKLPQEIVSLYR